MGISFGSINTGLPPNIVQQLVEAERQPIIELQNRKGKVEEQLKLVQDLTGKVREIYKGIRELTSTKGFESLKLESGDPNIVAGTVDRDAAIAGSYQVEVQKLAHKTSVLSNGFPDKNKTQVGVGYIKYKGSDGQTREVYIDKSNNTLEKIAAVINAKAVGVRASVIQDHSDKENPYKLMMTGKGVGEDQAVTFPTFYFLDGDQDFYVDKQRPAENGHVIVDGQEFDIDDNKLKDVIPGVTLDLRQAAPGREVTVTVAQDQGVIVGKIKSFVENLNAVLQFIQSQNALNEKSDTTKTLGGDSLLRSIENRFRDVLQYPIFQANGNIKYISQIGISFTRQGTLQFDEEKFNAAIAKQLPDVEEFFVGDGMNYGLAPQLKNAINLMLDNVTGPLTQRERGMRQKVEQFDHQIENKERMLAQREQTLKAQFARLEETMARLKTQGAYLQARLGTGGDFGTNLNQTGNNNK